MKRRVSIHRAIWPFRQPFRIADYVFEASDVLVVEIAEGEFIGRGEGVGVHFLNDRIDNMMEAAQSVRADVENGLTRQQLQKALSPGGARNAFDCALWDLEAKMAGRSVLDLAGITQRPVQTVFTLGIGADPQAMARDAAKASAFVTLKIKLDADRPIERVEAVRSARPDAKLVVDANQAFEADELPSLLEQLAGLDVTMVEQPLRRGSDTGLKAFTSPIPLCADESCVHFGELETALDLYDIINIKLDKCGGLTEALEIANATKAAGKRVMVGNMVGTSLSLAPALVLAQICDIVDLDGPLHLASDYLQGARYQGDHILAPPQVFWG